MLSTRFAAKYVIYVRIVLDISFQINVDYFI